MSAFEFLRAGYPITEVLKLLKNDPEEIRDFLMAFEDYFKIQLKESDIPYLKHNVPILKFDIAGYAKDGRKFCPFFVDLLYDENPNVRKNSALALGKNNYAKAVPNLIELLYDTNSEVVEFSISALDLLNEAYKDADNWGVLKTAMISAYTDLLKSKDWVIRGLAVDALGDMGPKAYLVLPKLHAMLNDNSETVSVRESARDTIRRIWPTQDET